MKLTEKLPSRAIRQAFCCAVVSCGLLVVSTATAAPQQCEVSEAVKSGRSAAMDKAFEEADNTKKTMSEDPENDEYGNAEKKRDMAQQCLSAMANTMGRAVKATGYTISSSILEQLTSIVAGDKCKELSAAAGGGSGGSSGSGSGGIVGGGIGGGSGGGSGSVGSTEVVSGSGGANPHEPIPEFDPGPAGGNNPSWGQISEILGG